jgi:hypothetical protein
MLLILLLFMLLLLFGGVGGIVQILMPYCWHDIEPCFNVEINFCCTVTKYTLILVGFGEFFIKKLYITQRRFAIERSKIRKKIIIRRKPFGFHDNDDKTQQQRSIKSIPFISY